MADDASAKAYALELRVNGLVAATLPLSGGTLTGDLHLGAVLYGAGGVIQVGDIANGAVPGSATAETWHDMRPLGNSFVGSITNEFPPQYRMSIEGWVEVWGAVQLPASGPYNGITFFTFPAGYRAAKFVSWPVVQGSGSMSGDTTASSPHAYTDATGVLQVAGISPSINSAVLRIGGKYPVSNNPITA